MFVHYFKQTTINNIIKPLYASLPVGNNDEALNTDCKNKRKIKMKNKLACCGLKKRRLSTSPTASRIFFTSLHHLFVGALYTQVPTSALFIMIKN